MNALKKCWPDVAAILLFVAISMAYFFAPTIQGKILFQHDSAAGVGMGKEISDYRQKGELSRWTNAAFSGMPTYQTAPSYESTDGLAQVLKAYHLWLPDYVWYLFVYLLGFYILLRAFNFRQSLAALGSIIWAFSSYFLIIIAAGHIWKVYALAYLPPMIAGIVLAYRGKYLKAIIVTSIFAAFEINANHVQMTYYYLFIIAFMVLAYLIESCREKQLPCFLKATGVCTVAALIALAINASNLYHTWEYQKESMRGKSELVKKDANQSQQTSSGLDRDYITQWSYGIDETWTLLIPNAKGGSNNEQLGDNAKAMAASDPQLAEMCAQWYQYWGNQPFTAGPVYVGAFVLMLFILGLFIVKGPMKWCLLAVTILSIMLSWGKNFMPLTDFFIDYMPMYSKFRTVSSILVIAEFTIPLLAMLALKKIVDDPDLLTKKVKWLYVSFALTAGIAAVFAIMPTLFFDFTSQADVTNLSRSLPKEYSAMIPDITSNLARMRVPIFTADCWRTVVIIVIGTLLLLLYKAKKLKAEYMIGGVIVLCLVDMWQVDKRYLNDGMFVPASTRESVAQQKTAADEAILQDKDPNYRVLNLTGDTFNENNTSYFHKSIGGYHAAKLRRYAELISAYIGPEMNKLNALQMTQGADMVEVTDTANTIPVLNMLNTKYLIANLGGQASPIRNKSAYGNAWFVSKVSLVNNANEELDKLGKIDPRHEAVADKKFADAIGKATANDSTASVKLTSYAPNHINYDVQSKAGGVIVFSEIYYPGWKATVDNAPVPVGRVNYVLRAINVKPGTHKVQLDFHPESEKITETIAYGASALLAGLVVVAIARLWIRRKKNGVLQTEE